jgi:phenylalanyl-tRNA synthetase beta subunit
VTFEVGSATTYDQVFGAIWQELEDVQKQKGYFFTLAHRDIFQAEGSDRKRMTFRIWLSHHDRTLVTDEVNGILERIAASLKKSLEATRI